MEVLNGRGALAYLEDTAGTNKMLDKIVNKSLKCELAREQDLFTGYVTQNILGAAI